MREQCHGGLWEVGGSSKPRVKKDTGTFPGIGEKMTELRPSF